MCADKPVGLCVVPKACGSCDELGGVLVFEQLGALGNVDEEVWVGEGGVAQLDLNGGVVVAGGGAASFLFLWRGCGFGGALCTVDELVDDGEKRGQLLGEAVELGVDHALYQRAAVVLRGGGVDEAVGHAHHGANLVFYETRDFGEGLAGARLRCVDVFLSFGEGEHTAFQGGARHGGGVGRSDDSVSWVRGGGHAFSVVGRGRFARRSDALHGFLVDDEFVALRQGGGGLVEPLGDAGDDGAVLG